MKNHLTKIVITIGPSCDSENIIKKAIKSGVNIFRFNFKHNSIEWHDKRIVRVNKISDQLGVTIGTLIDLQGTEIRVNMPFQEIKIKKGEEILFGENVFLSKKKGISISHPQIIPYLKNNIEMFADDGTFSFVLKKRNGQTYLLSNTTGELKNRKNFNIPNLEFPFSSLVKRDFEGLKLAQRHQIDYIALSFVRSKKDIKELRNIIKQYNLRAKIIAKIETKKALDNIDEIINSSDGIMIARGDLAIEIPREQVPFYQKEIIKKCLIKGVPVIIATQMIQSMTDNPVPTRAEISDIANAVYDFSDAVMLSSETSIGKYPIQSIEMIKRTVYFNEKKIDVKNLGLSFEINDKEEILCQSAYNAYLSYIKKGVKNIAFIVFTHSGRTARLISRYHPCAQIFAITPNKTVSESLTISFGIKPITYPPMSVKKKVEQKEIMKLINLLKTKKLINKKYILIILHGEYWTIQGETSILQIITP